MSNSDLVSAGNGLYVILHNLRSCYNVGSIFRSADAFGVRKIFLSGYTSTPETNPKEIGKTALGAEKNVAWEKYFQIGRLISQLKEQGTEVVAIEQGQGNILLEEYNPGQSLALIMGNEVRGLDSAVLKKVDQIVEIPMLGKKESLNVSVAFGIAAHTVSEKLRIRNKNSKKYVRNKIRNKISKNGKKEK